MKERNIKKVHSFVDIKQMLNVMGLEGCNEDGLKHELENNKKLKPFLGESLEQEDNSISVSKKISLNNSLLSSLTEDADKETNIDSKKNKVI